PPNPGISKLTLLRSPTFLSFPSSFSSHVVFSQNPLFLPCALPKVGGYSVFYLSFLYVSPLLAVWWPVLSAMAGRHLHELLREEQEPFALNRFIDERRCQLRRPPSGNPPPSRLHRHTHPHTHHRLQIKRHVPDVLEHRAFSPSALVKSPSSPFIPRRDPFDAKRSPLLHLPVEKSPSSASRITAALLLEAAMRIQKQQEQEQQQQGRKKRRKRRKKKETDNPSRRFGLGFLACVLKRLVVGKRQRGITGEGEAEPPFDVPAKDLLKWEARYGENAVERAVHGARHQQKEADLDMGDPHYGSKTDQEQRKGGEGKSPQRPTCRRCGIPECPQSDGGSVSGRASTPAGRPCTSSPPRTQLQPSSPTPPPRDPSPELQTPAASPDRRRTERQLFGGTGADGRPETSYYEEKKEQFSPVSVLDPPSDEEDHHHHHHHHHATELDAQVEQQEQQAVKEDDEEAAAADVDSFQHSLAVVQRAKQQLLSRLRRFERLAELDPVELERRLAEEDDEDEEEEDEDAGDSDGRPEAVGCLQDGGEAEAPEVCELVRAVLGLPGGASRKIPADTRRLVLDLAEEERRGVFWGAVAGPPDGVERTAEGVRRRFEAWKGVESDTIDMMVGMDLRQEGGDGWRRFPDEVSEAAAEVEAAAFASLVDELMDELMGYLN
ncbi:hypothetical protein Taro_009238, partial [Colocasia esculenta]|nr:hypothetical protein [Colocasia esculenta]